MRFFIILILTLIVAHLFGIIGMLILLCLSSIVDSIRMNEMQKQIDSLSDKSK